MAKLTELYPDPSKLVPRPDMGLGRVRMEKDVDGKVKGFASPATIGVLKQRIQLADDFPDVDFDNILHVEIADIYKDI